MRVTPRDLLGLPRMRARGVLCLPDPHLAASPPKRRRPGYREQALAKLRSALNQARELGLVPIVLGDLFHYPGEVDEALFSETLALFREAAAAIRPWALLGNHDQLRAAEPVTAPLDRLAQAGVLTLMDQAGPQFWLEHDGPVSPGACLVGASPWDTALPTAVDTGSAAATPHTVLWLTHHAIAFPDLRHFLVVPHEIPGVDWVINGHKHRPQPVLTVGRTRWANPGGMMRMKWLPRNRSRRPSVVIWTPERDWLQAWELPYRPFSEVFPVEEPPDQI